MAVDGAARAMVATLRHAWETKVASRTRSQMVILLLVAAMGNLGFVSVPILLSVIA